MATLLCCAEVTHRSKAALRLKVLHSVGTVKGTVLPTKTLQNAIVLCVCFIFQNIVHS